MSTPTPGACDKVGCPVLHDDPANPIHPPPPHDLPPGPLRHVNDFDTQFGSCAICGVKGNHDDVPHGLATGDGLTRYDLLEYLAPYQPATPVLEWWHVWKGELASGDGTLTITLGPTIMGPDDLGMDGRKIPIRERTFPMGLMDPDGPPGPEAQYVASFNQRPLLSEDEVNDAIDLWHDGDSDGVQELHEYLGWTEQEYKTWVETNEPPERLKVAWK